MVQKKDAIDSLFDFADKVVDGASAVLKDMPEPDNDDVETPVEIPSKKVIDVEVTEQPLLKSGPSGPTKPREVTLHIKAIAKRKNGGVGILAETATHDVVVINLDAKDWKTLCDNADWMRMVRE